MSFGRKACLTFLVLTASTAAFAANFTVNTTLDLPAAEPVGLGYTAAGTVSLRSAIQAVNYLAQYSVITVPAGTYTLTIAGRDENYCATGDLDILQPVTIQGAGPGLTIIQAGDSPTNGIDKVFSINPFWNVAFPTTISNLTIRHGRNTSSRDWDGYGGAMDWDGAGNGWLTIDNCVISDSSCSDGEGGGIAVTNAGTGRVTITNTTISNCSALNGTGGAIFVWINKTPAVLTGCNLTGNKTGSTSVASSGSGGAICASDASVQIHNCTISNNQAIGSMARGGGIYVSGNAALLSIDQQSVVSNNSCGLQGGGIFLNTYALGPNIFTSTITGNSAPTSGGGIYVACGALEMHFCRVFGNSAPTGSDAYKDSNNANLDVPPSPGALNAANCWWGSNAGPGAHVGVLAPSLLTTSPWLTLEFGAAPGDVRYNTSATYTASLNRNSSGAIVGGTPVYSVPTSTSASWSVTGPGSLSPTTSSFLNGSTSTTFSAGAELASGSVTVNVDGQTVSAPVNTNPVTLSGLSAE